VNLKLKRGLFLHDYLFEEARVICIVHPVIGVYINLVHIKPFAVRLLATASIIVIATSCMVVVIIIVISAVPILMKFVGIVSSFTSCVTGIVVATTSGGSVSRPVVLPLVFPLVDVVSSFIFGVRTSRGLRGRLLFFRRLHIFLWRCFLLVRILDSADGLVILIIVVAIIVSTVPIVG